MLILFLGSWTAADLIADNNTVLQATRAGARYAAELGNNGSPTDSNLSDAQAADALIIEQVLPVVSKLTNAQVVEIDIYGCSNGGVFTPACTTNGAYIAGEPVDRYDGSGSPTALPWANPYTLNLRDQVHPDESDLGVMVTFRYTSPSLAMFSQSDVQYTIMRLAPVE